MTRTPVSGSKGFKGRENKMSSFDDGHLDENTRTVLHASRALDVREIDFFRLAWRWWRGGAPREREIEHAFAAYMFHKVAPSWVRQTGREVLRRAEAGVLDPDDFGVRRFNKHEPPDPRGRVIVAGFSVVAFGFVALLTWYVATGDADRTFACAKGAGQGMGFAAKVAQLYTGNDDPFRCTR